jgi:hypothetical protein
MKKEICAILAMLLLATTVFASDAFSIRSANNAPVTLNLNSANDRGQGTFKFEKDNYSVWGSLKQVGTSYDWIQYDATVTVRDNNCYLKDGSVRTSENRFASCKRLPAVTSTSTTFAYIGEDYVYLTSLGQFTIGYVPTQ